MSAVGLWYKVFYTAALNDFPKLVHLVCSDKYTSSCSCTKSWHCTAHPRHTTAQNVCMWTIGAPFFLVVKE
jgi:hypothetical protein